jgi:beta-glucosidase
VPSLTRAEKVALTGGVDLWHTAGVERLGLPGLRLTDGPSGARGVSWSSGESVCFPCGSALAATWNPQLARRVGRALAAETRAKGAQVLLAPTVNIHRHPLTGRHFECMSEDPHLTSEMAVEYILGLQEAGVAAVVKHFVCNDQEHERHTISVEVDERTLREIYLPPFEAAVRRAGVWGIMSAYNRLGGVYCSEHRWLLSELLTDEWGFDGLVVSDWRGTESQSALEAGLDLEMPGPPRFLGGALPDEVSDAALDRAAERLLRLMRRVTVGPAAEPEDPPPSAQDVAYEAAAEAIVLLRNDGVLPLGVGSLRRLAVIGPLADRLAVQGGGSAEVTPTHVSSALDELRASLPPTIEVDHQPGCVLPGPLRPLDGLVQIEYFANPDFGGPIAGTETLSRTWTRWMNAPYPGVPQGHFSARLRTSFTPPHSGDWQLGVSSAGQSRVLLDGRLVLENFEPMPGEAFGGRGSREVRATVHLEASRQYQLLVELRVDSGAPFAAIRVGAEPALPDDALLHARDAARSADAAVVIVGYDGRWESEGFDRPSLQLPGEQDALVRAVAAVNPRTVVVVNAGAPVAMDWSEEVAALLQVWFPGQAGGHALADVLVGRVNPSGRLPTTFPRRLEDTPAFATYPGADGVARYAEGLLVGYRHYDVNEVEPRFCFGHGLSYTTFELSRLLVDGDEATVDVTNTGERAGAEVVQVYVRRVDSAMRQLRGFAKVALEPGASHTVRVPLPRRAFSHWEVDAHDWRVEPGEFEVLVGASSRDIRLRQRITVA